MIQEIIYYQIADIFRRISEQKLFWEMNQRIKEQVQVLVQVITMNIGYPVALGNLELLRDQTFYFNICSIIFPELKPKINKIVEDTITNPTQKMQKLFEILTEELQINLIVLSANQILNGNLLYIYNLLIILKQFSQLPPLQISLPKNRFRERLHSCPLFYKNQSTTKQPVSARVQYKLRNLSDSDAQESNNEQIQIKQFKQENLFQMDMKDQKIDNEFKQIQNQEQFKTQNEIKKKDSEMSNKLSKLQSQKKITKRYGNSDCKNKKLKPYKQIYMKDNRDKSKKQLRQIRTKSANKSNWVKDIKQIDNYFKSFQYKLRDQKHKYLRKMQQIIRQQQNERMRFQSKLRQDRAKTVEQQQKRLLANLNNTHKAKLQILRQRAQTNKQTINLIKKQYGKIMKVQKKQFRCIKKKQQQQIKLYITNLNNKIFNKLQQGGEMQKMVQQMYRKF